MTTPPSNVSKEDWEYLCDMWSETKYKENAEKKVKARAQRKINSKNGSKSTIRYHIERGLDLESSTGQLETWRLTHWDAKKGWISTDAAAKYVSLLVCFYAKYQLLGIQFYFIGVHGLVRETV
ncbi:hypothetical protein HanLR1_Chr05g0187201 [Helianthus annuus]|nr:hypothetical protein HanLR1_Chr05g0187201 [Helianthus annuus]